VCILVATSGDTGKGALEGFRDVDHTKILVFYPKDGVSDIQQLQMQTQEGDNVGVCAVVGNFDDAQTGVKRLFSDAALRDTLAGQGFFFSSANSINWGRILPQIVYYISAYCDLLRDGRLELGDPVNVCVPTGNFGNILTGSPAAAGPHCGGGLQHQRGGGASGGQLVHAPDRTGHFRRTQQRVCPHGRLHRRPVL